MPPQTANHTRMTPKPCTSSRRVRSAIRSFSPSQLLRVDLSDGPLCARSCHSMNAHFAYRRALTLFWRYYSGAIRTLSQGLRCPCQSRAEDQATATPVWLWLAEPTFSLCADEGYERSGAIAGNRRPASKIVELGSWGPIQRETHYRRSPVFVSPGAGHP